MNQYARFAVKDVYSRFDSIQSK